MRTILLIDDTTEILENFTEYLEMEGYKVLACNNGRNGIELAIEFIPDLIICDVLMPEMEGHDALKLLLETSKVFSIPFIFSTSLPEKIEKADPLQLGADECIIKPFDPETLLAMVKALMRPGNKRQRLANL